MVSKKSRKKEIREEILKRREGLSKEYYVEANSIITENIFELAVYQQANTIFVFNTMGKEFDTQPIIEDALSKNKRIGLPRVISLKEGMKVHEYQTGDQLIESDYGAMEPSASADEFSPDDIDLVIMPCVTANNKGDRIGYGGGFYDRFLSQYSGQTVLPIFSPLQTPNIPVEEHDQKMNYIVTEESVVKVLK